MPYRETVFQFLLLQTPLQGTSLYGPHRADMFESFAREGIAESWGALLFTPNQKSQIAFQIVVNTPPLARAY